MIRTTLLASAAALLFAGSAMAANPVPMEPPLGSDVVTFQQMYPNGYERFPDLLAPIGALPAAQSDGMVSQDVYGGLRPEPNEVVNKSNAYEG